MLARGLNTVVVGVATFAESAPVLASLKVYLTKRVVISCIVLAYTFYEPFTSTMLLILQCQRVGGPEPGIQEYYNREHAKWLQGNSSLEKPTASMGLWGKQAPAWEDGFYW